MKFKFSLIFALFLGNAYAAVDTNIHTKANIEQSCYIKANDIDFGDVRNLIKTRTMTGELKVRCTNKTSYEIELDSLNYQMSLKNEQKLQSSTTEKNNASSKNNNAQTGNGQINNPNTNGQTNADGSKPNKNNNAQKGNRQINNPNTNEQTNSTNGSRELLGQKTGADLKYLIILPGEPTKEWRAGKYNYISTATGIEESIPVEVTITENLRTLPEDKYSDTILVKLIY